MSSSEEIAATLAHLRDYKTGDCKNEASDLGESGLCLADAVRKATVICNSAGEEAKGSLPDLLALIQELSHQEPGYASAERDEAVVEIALRLLSIISNVEMSPSDRAHVAQTALETMNSAIDREDPATLKGSTMNAACCGLCKFLQQQDENYECVLLAVRSLRLLFQKHCVVEAALGFNIAVSLSRLLLRSSNQYADLNGEICNVLLLLGDTSSDHQAIWSHELAQTLVHFLKKAYHPVKPVIAVVQLLQRITEHTQVHGRVINDGLVLELFRILAKNYTSSELAAIVCSMLSSLMEFAQECHLDITPFTNDTVCNESVLIGVMQANIEKSEIVQDVLKCFLAASKNLCTLPQIINSTSIEGIAEALVAIISHMERATIESIHIENPSSTLPALFLCLRNCQDIKFISHVYAIITRHWKLNNPDARAVVGYVELAVLHLRTILTDSSDSWPTQVAEVCNFIREILLVQDGDLVVSGCGGGDLLLLLHQAMSVLSSSSKSLESENETPPIDTETADSSKLSPLSSFLSVFLQLLEIHSATGFQSLGTIRESNARSGDKHYNNYVSEIIKCEQDSIVARKSSTKAFSGEFPVDQQSDIQDNELSRPSSTEVLYPNELNLVDGDASDASDASEADDNDELPQVEIGADDDVALPKEVTDCGLFEVVDAGSDDVRESGKISVSILEDTLHKNDRDSTSPRHSIPDILMTGSLSPFSICQSDLQVKGFYYESSNGIRFPRHPTRNSSSGNSASGLGSDLIWTVPDHDEPCPKPDAEVAAQFVASTSARRAQFDASNSSDRARIVYQGASFRELLRQRLQSATGKNDRVQKSNQQCDNEKAFQDRNCDNEYPYEIMLNSDAFSKRHHDSLTFDSMFESGNLERAIRVGESEYDLVLRYDLHTNGHMQWFYFAVSNAQPFNILKNDRRQYRFNIINLCKPDSMFNRGLQPVLYSVKEAHENNIGWRRSGRDIYYFSNQYSRGNMSSGASRSSGGCYYTLTFTLEFPHADDTYLIAHSFPYTLNTHRLHMSSITHSQSQSLEIVRVGKPIGGSVIRRSELCKTLGGTKCDLLTITEFDTRSCNGQELETRRAVIITSRVHPGEPQASWMMRGVIDFLVSDFEVARALRRIFIFYLVPMLNPDGVYYGNNRCNLSACDLNRHWLKPREELHPTIYHTKELIAREHQTRGVVFYCDLHGHSRKQNVFMYGCDTKKRPNPRARFFPQNLAKLKHSFLSLPDCSFKVSKDKEATARVVLAYELEIPWSFTLEASFCGTNITTRCSGSCDESETPCGVHFTTHDLCRIGRALCESIFTNTVTDGSVRERLCVSLEDEEINFPLIAEPFLRETALSSKILTMKPKFGKSFVGIKSSGKDKIKRKGVSCLQLSDDASTPPFNTVDTRASRTLSNPQPPREPIPLRKSSSIVVPEQVTPFVGTLVADIGSSQLSIPFDLLASTSPRARLGGRKFRIKKSKSSVGRSETHRHRTSQRSPTEANYSLQGPNHKVQACSGSAGGRQSATRSGPMWPPVPGQEDINTSVSFAIRATASAGGMTLPEVGYEAVRHPQFGYSSTMAPNGVDAPASIIGTRSPKPPAPKLRFRGAGKQYAVVNTGFPLQQQRNAAFELLRADSAMTYTYEQDLLNASTISMRQRSGSTLSLSPSSVSRGNTTNCRLHPLHFERQPAAPPTTTESPSTWSRNV